MIHYKTMREISVMWRANQLVARILDRLDKMIEPGCRLNDLDREAEKMILAAAAVPTFKGYRNYPASTCISVDDQVVHGIPNHRRLRPGNIVSIDVGVTLEGFVADSARTFAVGNLTPVAERLMAVTQESLHRGIEQAHPGNRIGDISASIQEFVEHNGFSVVRTFFGHGVGRNLHEEPQVPNFGSRGRGLQLREGLVIAIEPMVNEKGHEVRFLDDHWTAVTEDGGLSCHFEHSVAITADGPLVLSRLAGNGWVPPILENYLN